MGELYERLLDEHPTKPKISTDGLQACMRLIRANLMTVPQANQLFIENYGGALGPDATGSNAGMIEAADLFGTIPTGSTTVLRLSRLEQSALIESVLVIADTKSAPFNTPALLRAAFGVPDRS